MYIFTILSNCKDATEIAYFLKFRKDYSNKLLNLKYGVPSHDTIYWVFRIINPNEFMNIFINCAKEIIYVKYYSKHKVIPTDGKAIKSATDKVNNANIPYFVSVFSQELVLSSSRVKVCDKSNEITAISD